MSVSLTGQLANSFEPSTRPAPHCFVVFRPERSEEARKDGLAPARLVVRQLVSHPPATARLLQPQASFRRPRR